MTTESWIKLMNWGKCMGCHQMPSRSFFYKGYQFPVCARCTGVFISSFLALAVIFFYKIPVPVCIAMSFVMLIDWGLQAAGIMKSTNIRRFITGLIGGFGYSTLYYYFLFFLIHIFKNIYSLLFNYLFQMFIK